MTNMLRVRVGCEFVYDTPYPTPMTLIVRPAGWDRHRILQEAHILDPVIPFHEFTDSYGNLLWRVHAPIGTLRIGYDAIAEVPAAPDPVLPGTIKHPVQDLPDEVLIFTLPSRHCPSDQLLDDAWSMFGSIDSGWEQVQAICDWLHGNVEYGAGSNSSTTAFEAYKARRGVCRDFAHLGVTFCRALNIPARYVAGYLPDIGIVPPPIPMDFHAYFEAFLGGQWHVFDARHNFPRIGRVRIGVGRDAVDVAFATIYGSARLTTMNVWADEVSETISLMEKSV